MNCFTKMVKLACIFILFAPLFGQMQGDTIVFRFANVFGSHMVLQQAPKRSSTWGYGEVGQELVVLFSGEMYRSIVTERTEGEQTLGVWTVMLPSTTFGGSYRIEAQSTVNGSMQTIALEDVMFGDVWICSGQSNMVFTVNMSDNGAKAINESAQYNNIRVFTAELDCETKPQMELKNVREPWSRASPENIGGPDQQYFSAVCWYYAVQLYKELKYPIGLVATARGGTPVAVWSSPDALAACGINETVKIVDNMTEVLEQRNRSAPEDHHLKGPRQLSCLWNAMIFPFLNMTIYGSIWYQGENDARYPLYPYNCTFPAMIDDWREKWYISTQHSTDPMFPFGFVQLSTFGNGTGATVNFAPLRWDQTAQYGYAPNDRQKNVFMAVAMDLGNPNSTYGSIHPTDKTDVGNRLALAGLAVGYGKDEYYTGPLVANIKRQTKPPSITLEVIFKSLNGEIEVRNTAGFEVHCENTANWVEAPILDHSPVSVIIMPGSSDCVADKVRYAWSDNPCPKLKCAVYSGGLPSPPFMVDGPFEEVENSLLEKLFPLYM